MFNLYAYYIYNRMLWYTLVLISSQSLRCYRDLLPFPLINMFNTIGQATTGDMNRWGGHPMQVGIDQFGIYMKLPYKYAYTMPDGILRPATHIAPH
jgi:hypothetical protein